MSNAKVQLYQKMLKVYQAVDYLQKDDKVQFGSTNYKAISEEKVTSTVRAALVENGLIVFPIEQVHKKEGNLTTVDVKYKLIDTETGEHEIIVSSGTGADTQDKGVGKAMTYAFKYLFLRTFAIPTGEDPDKTSSAELDEKERKAKEAAAKKSKTDIPPTSLKTKYEAGKGNMDGFDDWVKKMQEQGHNFKSMEELLTKALLKKAEEGKNNA